MQQQDSLTLDLAEQDAANIDTAATGAAEAPGTDIATQPPAARAAVALGSKKTETHLRALVVKSAAITNIVDANGRAEAHASYMALRNARTTINKTGKSAREDAQAFASAVIKEEARLIEITEPEEKRVMGLRDAFDAEEKRKAEELAKKQAERKAALQAKVDAIRNLPLGMADASAEEIAVEIEALRNFVPAIDVFFEFAKDAQDAANAAVVSMLALHERRVAKELADAEAERQRIEAARVAQARADQEAAALAERQAAAARAEAELAERLKAIADQQAALDAQAASIAKQRQDDADQLSAEREKFEADRKAFVDQQLAAQQAKDAAAKMEADHAEALAINAAGHYYSSTTFRGDGQPIMCNPDGTRNIFCDVDEDSGESPAVHTAETALAAAHAGIADAEAELPGGQGDEPDACAVDPAPPATIVTAATSPSALAADVVDVTITPPTLRLGQIGERLGFSLSAEFLRNLGFEVADKQKGACLYHEEDYSRILMALIDHISSKVPGGFA